jgi:hypothetical protein
MMPPPADDFLQGMVDEIRDLTEQRETLQTQHNLTLERLRSEQSRASDLQSQVELNRKTINHLIDTFYRREY